MFHSTMFCGHKWSQSDGICGQAMPKTLAVAYRYKTCGIRQQFLWDTTEEGPRVQQQQVQVHIRVPTRTQIHSTGATACPSTSALGGVAFDLFDELSGHLGPRTLILRFVFGD